LGDVQYNHFLYSFSVNRENSFKPSPGYSKPTLISGWYFFNRCSCSLFHWSHFHV